jgi:maltose-binding protein MalE
MANQVGIPNALRGVPGGQILGSVAQRVGKLAYGDANKELAVKLAETMANPKQAALLMEQAGIQGKPLTSENQRKLAKMLLMQSTAQAAQ